jgi:WXG100 family type VII secretion target
VLVSARLAVLLGFAQMWQVPSSVVAVHKVCTRAGAASDTGGHQNGGLPGVRLRLAMWLGKDSGGQVRVSRTAVPQALSRGRGRAMAEQMQAIGATSGFRVTPEEVQAASVQVDNTASAIQGQLDALKSYVRVNVESYWQGDAHQAFDVYMAEWDVYANMLHEALTGIAQGLRGTYVNYSQSEQSAKQKVTQLQNELPPLKLG